MTAKVIADETRPLLQGSRLTAWELAQAGIDVTVLCDSMAGALMREGKADLVITGADRIAEKLAPDALRLLAQARVAQSNKDAVAALEAASRKQRTMIEEFKSLLDRLDRWNEFQDVITNTRTLLDQQRDVKARAKNLQGGKDK